MITDRIGIHQEPITRSVQLSYFRATAFSQVGLFLDTHFPLKVTVSPKLALSYSKTSVSRRPFRRKIRFRTVGFWLFRGWGRPTGFFSRIADFLQSFYYPHENWKDRLKCGQRKEKIPGINSPDLFVMHISCGIYVLTVYYWSFTHSRLIGYSKLIPRKGLSKYKPTCENAVS